MRLFSCQQSRHSILSQLTHLRAFRLVHDLASAPPFWPCPGILDGDGLLDKFGSGLQSECDSSSRMWLNSMSVQIAGRKLELSVDLSVDDRRIAGSTGSVDVPCSSKGRT
jgi:hypothetical protein